MTLPPDDFLYAALLLIHRTTSHARNLALNPDTPHQKMEDLMDAINHLPEMMMKWEHFSEDAMYLHFSTYDSKWRNEDDSFGLKQTFDDIRTFRSWES